MKTLLLVDGSSYLYRAFHALAPLRSPRGEPTGAVYGVLNMLRRLKQNTPHDYAAVVFDAKGKNFRHALYPEYKANRPPMPEDLRPQVARVRELTALSGWKILSVAGVEADDVIATLARRAEGEGFRVILSSGDKDLMQLVNENIIMIDTMKNTVYDRAGVRQKFGVEPEQIIDILTLTGDATDNVPGVPRWGAKTAAKWLGIHGNLKNLIARADEIKGAAGESLRAALPNIALSRQLITLKDDVDLSAFLPGSWNDLRPREPDRPALNERLRLLGFKIGMSDEKTPSDRKTAATPDLFANTENRDEAKNRLAGVAASEAGEPLARRYRTATTESELDDLCRRLADAREIGLHTASTFPEERTARIVGIGFAFAPGDAVYVPLAHGASPERDDSSTIANRLRSFLENPDLRKIGHELKRDRRILAGCGIALRGIAGDSALASYLVESHLGHDSAELAKRHLNIDAASYESLCGKGAKQISFADLPPERARDYACEKADLAPRTEKRLRAMMNPAQEKMYRQLELPLAEVLFAMEEAGILLDTAELRRQSAELGEAMTAAATEAFRLAGETFNLNSPMQLQGILFGRLGIPTRGIKKTARGYSTDEGVLEKLALDHPLPRIILAHRALSKLKSTYTDKLPALIDRRDGRVHTNFAQTVAVTGRLASNNPNLQNIPVRTPEGRRIRRAFVAPEGCVLMSADYSQIELRIMAHLSGDETLIDAFRHNEDVHRHTAAAVFGIAPDEVTPEQRRCAKTVNFGLIYGMSAYGLARSLGISAPAAREFIERYFARYPKVADYIENTKKFARENGYVETLFGRRLYLPGINDARAVVRAGAERAAVNAPMQGTASDIIKKAMIDVYDSLRRENLRSRILLQVHDELISEVPGEEIDIMRRLLPATMEAVGAEVLTVPLAVQTGMGQNWDEAH